MSLLCKRSVTDQHKMPCRGFGSDILTCGFLWAQADIKQVKKVLAGAMRTVQKNFPGGLPPLPAVTIPDPASIKVPTVPEKVELDAAGRHRADA